MIYATPNYVVIGSSERMLPEMTSECCDQCTRRVWITPKLSLILSEAEYREDRSAVLCVGHAIAEYGHQMVAQILISQQED